MNAGKIFNPSHICRCKDTDGHVTVSVFFDEDCPAVTSGEKVIDEVQKLTTVLEDALKELSLALWCCS